MSKLNLSGPLAICAAGGLFEAAHAALSGGGGATLFTALCCGALGLSARFGKL